LWAFWFHIDGVLGRFDLKRPCVAATVYMFFDTDPRLLRVTVYVNVL
jgi:hypothetical protein